MRPVRPGPHIDVPVLLFQDACNENCTCGHPALTDADKTILESCLAKPGDRRLPMYDSSEEDEDEDEDDSDEPQFCAVPVRAMLVSFFLICEACRFLEHSVLYIIHFTKINNINRTPYFIPVN